MPDLDIPDFRTTINDIHYVKHAKRFPNFWHDLYIEEITRRITRSGGENFKIIIQDKTNLSDYYSIPYSIYRPLLNDALFDEKRKRWIFTIHNNMLRITGDPDNPIDVTRYYQNHANLFPNGIFEDTAAYLDAQNEEDSTNEVFFEGGRRSGYRSYFERKRKYRIPAIKFHGTTCKICGFNFEKVYGNHGKNFIEVHHLIPISSLEEATSINYKTDMTVLCANCHRMIHKKKDNILSIEDLRHKLRT
jgi:hypothetical protein